jgi:hypothetical protein
MAVWYSLWSFGILFPIWYVWTKKNLATLVGGDAFSQIWRETIRTKKKHFRGNFGRGKRWTSLASITSAFFPVVSESLLEASTSECKTGQNTSEKMFQLLQQKCSSRCSLLKNIKVIKIILVKVSIS